MQLAPGLWANAYIPTAAERTGNFSAFATQLIDPATNSTFLPTPGVIPTSRMGPGGTGNPVPV